MSKSIFVVVGIYGSCCDRREEIIGYSASLVDAEREARRLDIDHHVNVGKYEAARAASEAEVPDSRLEAGHLRTMVLVSYHTREVTWSDVRDNWATENDECAHVRAFVDAQHELRTSSFMRFAHLFGLDSPYGWSDSFRVEVREVKAL